MSCVGVLGPLLAIVLSRKINLDRPKNVSYIHNVTHGKSNTPEYQAWVSMIQRCENPKYITYSYYGGRGISICTRWRESLDRFLEDMGKRPTGKYSLDRIDNSRNYEPENCRWATVSEQMRNRRDRKMYSFKGRKMLLVEWANELGIRMKLLHQRIYREGWTVERAFTTHPRAYRDPNFRSS